MSHPNMRLLAARKVAAGGGGGFSFVQGAGKQVNSVNNTTLAYSSNVTSGNLLIVSHAHWVGAVSSITTPTDTRGNTYTGITAEQSANNVRFRSFYAIANGSGANTVTFDIGGTASAGDITCAVAEFSGNHSTPLDQTQVGSGTSTTPSSGNVTPTENDELLYAAVSHDGDASNSITEEGGWNLIYEWHVSSSGMPISVVYKIQTTATTEDADWTIGASVLWRAHIGSFKAA